MSIEKKNLGNRGELLASQYLLGRGYKIINRNFRTRQGEIDIVCRKNNSIIFIEVRTRTSRSYGPAEESITLKKMLTLAKISQLYLQRNKLVNAKFRLDLIVVNIDNLIREAKITHLKNIIIDIEEDLLDEA